jgi:ABC-type multidrug transport system fused ATPase/permease subunit
MNHAAQYSLQVCSQWLVLRLQLLALLVSSSAAFVAASQYHVRFLQIPAGAVGLALSYALALCGLLNGVLHTFTQVEMDLVSIERLEAYIDHDQHEPEDGLQLEHFPPHGSIEFVDLSLSYDQKQTQALTEVSFSVKPNEFVGIVGRTGAGKSSLIHVLLRLYESSGGRIEIDGHDVKDLHLKTLRSGICVIAQDGCLFDANIRTNLDPLMEREDHELWRAIDACAVRPIVARLGGLDGEVGDRGMLLSSGERQLLCLVRALIQKAKIVCLDEATSAMDSNTEAMLHSTLRKAFRQSTVLLIAHRLSSVLNCDRVLVMDAGRTVEFDAPDKLIQDTKSMFFRMWSANEHNSNAC